MTEANREYGYELTFWEPRLTSDTAPLAQGFRVVCSFANDHVDASALRKLKDCGVELIALRTAGFNHVDLDCAAELGIRVVRVPAYSPHSVAEHAVALVLALNRKIPQAHARIRDLNFSLDGLVGFDLFGKTIGVVGTGKIGTAFARIMTGFGCRVLAHDPSPSPQLKDLVSYVSLPELYRNSMVVSLHLPLLPETRHLIDDAALEQMPTGVFLINTGRGALIDTPALIRALKRGTVGAAGLDVYEEEENVFFQDLSGHVLQDDLLARLLTFPNVLITSHQAFLTREALQAIARTTLDSIHEFETGAPLAQEIRVRQGRQTGEHQ